MQDVANKLAIGFISQTSIKGKKEGHYLWCFELIIIYFIAKSVLMHFHIILSLTLLQMINSPNTSHTLWVDLAPGVYGSETG